MSGQAQFVQLLTEAQPRLYTYIRSLIPDRHQANDVLQNTNVGLWEKSDVRVETRLRFGK